MESYRSQMKTLIDRGDEEQLTPSARIGNWIVNGCLVVAVASAWVVEKWPNLTFYALGAILTAAAMSLAVLWVVKYREKSLVAATWASTGRGHYFSSVVGEEARHRRYENLFKTLISRNAELYRSRAGHLEYESLLKKLISRDAELSRSVWEQGLDQEYESLFKGVTGRESEWDRLRGRMIHRSDVWVDKEIIRPRGAINPPESGHYRVKPRADRYKVTVGVVEIEVDGDETKVRINDNRKVSIETPTQASPLSLPVSSNTEQNTRSRFKNLN